MRSKKVMESNKTVPKKIISKTTDWLKIQTWLRNPLNISSWETTGWDAKRSRKHYNEKFHDILTKPQHNYHSINKTILNFIT